MKKAPIIWTNVLLFSITTLIAAIGVPWYALTVGSVGLRLLPLY